MPELIVLFIVLIAIPSGIVIALAWYLSARRKPSQPVQPPQIPRTIEDRLLEIDSLRSRNLISEVEHEEKRRVILNSI